MNTMLGPGFNNTRSLPPQACSNTPSGLAVIHVDEANGWVVLHLANTGLLSDLAFSIDGHSMIVYAADGLYVELSEIQVSIFFRPY